MDGVHDMGGMHGFGAIPIEADEPIYHEPWEGRAAAIVRRLMQNTTVDHFRYTIEQMPPAEYLASRYYERWLWAAEHMAAEQGLFDEAGGDTPPERNDDPWAEPARPPRFTEGQRVRVLNPVTRGHTRVPRYARRQEGTIVRRASTWPHPTESAATGRHGPPEQVYAVAFDAADVFGPDAVHTLIVHIWERDLEEAV
jgi:nitrile hydratase